MIASLSFGLFATQTAHAASVTKVERTTWGATGVPSYVTMFIYVPDRMAEKPPVVVACHSCGTPVDGFKNSISGILAAADKNGFIVILPEATGRNCWDVGNPNSLKHDGGGDTQAVAQMVKYTLGKYNGDASRVYVMGGSSGAMMTQAMVAVYPELFQAGSARAGVPAGCWADAYDTGRQWSNNCAGGNTTKTAQAWGDQVRAMNPGYTGPRPRVQLFHGTADGTINFKNMGEATKEWTNVLKLSETPSSTDMITSMGFTYKRSFWKNACDYTVFETWAAENGSHSMPSYEQDAILKFFGLDSVMATDPEPACGGGGGSGGAGGSGGGGGAPAAGGAAAAGGASSGGSSISSGGLPASNGGTTSVGAGGAPALGGTTTGAGGKASSGGAPSNGGSVFGGATSTGSGGVITSAGGTASAGAPATPPEQPDASGCSCVVGKTPSRPFYSAALALGAAVFAFRRRGGRRH